MKMKKAMLVGAMTLLSSSLYALECIDVSDHAPGAFKTISIDDSAGTVVLSIYLNPDEPTEMTLIKGPGSYMVYNFNEHFTEKMNLVFQALLYRVLGRVAHDRHHCNGRVWKASSAWCV